MSRCRKLSAAEKAAVWAKPTANAGVGWWPNNREVIQGEVGSETIPYDHDGDPEPLDFEDGRR